MSNLWVQNLSVRDKDDFLLVDISFYVRMGEITLIAGPKNSGKQTLKNVLTGEYKNWVGTVKLNGECIKKNTKRVVIVDHPVDSIHKKLTVFDYITIPIQLSGEDAQEAEQLATHAATLFNCEHLLDRSLESLSIGQLIKAKLIKAYLSSPIMVIIDHPFYRLSTNERNEVLSSIKEAQGHMKDIFIVLFCQYIKEWFSLCDKFVILHRRKVQQVGTKNELLTKPSNTFVASFVHGNRFTLLTGTVKSGMFVSESFAYSLYKNDVTINEGKEIILGITPDQFILVDFSTENADVEVTIPIYVIEEGLDKNYLYSNIGGQAIIAEFKKNDRIKEGMLIKVGFLLENTLLFNGSTKTRLMIEG